MSVHRYGSHSSAGRPFNWSFNWKEGGYNGVFARTRDEALRKALEFEAKVNVVGKKQLHVDVSTLRPDPKHTEDKRWSWE